LEQFADTYRPPLEAELEQGETLRGICAANHRQSAFKGRLVAIGITDRRLLVLGIGRRGATEGVESITPEQVADAKAGGAGGGWPTAEAAIADHTAISLTLKTTDGRKLKLMMMRGEGRMFGKLGGGEPQRLGVAALGEWFERLSP